MALEAQQPGPGRDVAFDCELVPCLGMADIVNRDVVVLAPEEGNGGKSLAVPEHIECRGLPLALGHHPMLDANALATIRIRPARNVTDRPDRWRARFEIGIYDDAPINGQPGPFGKFDSWPHADAGHHEIHLERTTAFQTHLITVNGARCVLEVKNDTVLLVERAYEIAHLWTQNTLHRSLFRRHHMDFDSTCAQGGRDLEPDKARAQHDRSGSWFGSLNDRPTVRERAKRAHVRLLGTGYRQADRLGARCEQQTGKRDFVPVGKRGLPRRGIGGGEV